MADIADTGATQEQHEAMQAADIIADLETRLATAEAQADRQRVLIRSYSQLRVILKAFDIKEYPTEEEVSEHTEATTKEIVAAKERAEAELRLAREAIDAMRVWVPSDSKAGEALAAYDAALKGGTSGDGA